jgi:integrase
LSTRRHKLEQGIAVRHEKGCRTYGGGRCNCSPSYQARAWSNAAGKEVRRSFKTKAEAKAWRARAMAGHVDKLAGATSSPVLGVLADWVFDEAEAGRLLNRSGDAFKPSVIRSYRSTYSVHIGPAIGKRRVGSVRRRDVQAVVSDMTAQGLSPSTVRNALLPLRLIYRVAIRDELGAATSPIEGVELPAVRGKRERIASPVEAASLIDVCDDFDRAIWATAFYGGLRRGELMALEVANVDFDQGVIRVMQSYDPGSRKMTAPKSRAGIRTVPMVKVLRRELAAHLMRRGQRGALMFARPDGRPFSPEATYKRSRKRWDNAKLAHITMHECRHSFASMMIAAGVNAKTLQEIGGWSSIAIVFDRYGHLMPGAREEAAGLLEAYLDRETAGRV